MATGSVRVIKAAGGATECDDFPDELMAHHATVVQPALPPVVHVQIRAADGADLDPNDRIAGLEDLRVGDLLEPDGLVTMVGQRLHRRHYPIEKGMCR